MAVWRRRGDLALSRASPTGCLDPQVLWKPCGTPPEGHRLRVRGSQPGGGTNLGLSQEGLLGRRLSDGWFRRVDVRTLRRYAVCLDTGEPVILDDTRHHSEILDDTRRYDVW